MDFTPAVTRRIIAAANRPATGRISRRTTLRSDFQTGHPEAMHDKIPDFTDTELWVIRQAVSERFRKQLELQQADAELRLDPGDRELTVCPVVYWREDQAQFVIFKTGAQAYRNQFFYSVREQYGTGRDEYTDIGECVMTLLQVQADHAAKSAANPA